MSSVLINIDVPDLAKATQFYCDAFDLKVGRKFGEDVIEIIGLPSPIYLLKKEKGSSPFYGAKTERSYERHWTPVHLDIVVDSIERFLVKAKRAGGTQESGVRTAAWGKLVLFSDPFGNGFCLIEFIGKGYEEIANKKEA